MLVELTVRGFRNLEPLTWRPGAGAHLLQGENGAGKTSLLEAIYTLATTRSFRAPRLADCRRHDAEAFSLTAEVDGGPGSARARLELSLVEGKRERRLNGATTSLAEHLTALPVIAWTSADVELLNGPPEVRRRFLDRGVVGLRPAALAVLGRYRRALAQKRELLARGGGWAALESWNGVLAGAAAEVIRRRQEYVNQLRRCFGTVLEEYDLSFPAITLHYRTSPAAAGRAEPERAMDAILLDALERAADEERRRGLPLVGPHRDDLRLGWADHQLRRVVSAGERKSIGLALLAAHGRVLEQQGRQPIYLLDDADTELSARTLRAVWGGFAGAAQVFASTNRPEIWQTMDMAGRWHLQKGVLEKL